MSNVSLSAFTPTKIFAVKPSKLSLVRTYEYPEYAFMASDVSLDCNDAGDLYDTITSGEEVTLVASKGGISKFRGTFQSEGSAFDLDKNIYTLSAVHAIKKVFDLAKAQTESDLMKRVTFPNQYDVFDAVLTDALHNGGICAVKLDPMDFAYANKLYGGYLVKPSNPVDVYAKFLQANQTYTTRDYWIDFCKHYRCVIYLDNDLDESGNYVLHVVPRLAMAKINWADDDLICGYNEVQNDPQYDAVIFPLFSNGNPCFVRYDIDGAHLLSAPPENIEGNATDIRVPSGSYNGTSFPFKSLPDFNLSFSNPGWYMSSVGFGNYCDQTFGSLVKPYKEIEVTYRETIDVNPLESKMVRGMKLQITEIEDDLMYETTKITTRLF